VRFRRALPLTEPSTVSVVVPCYRYGRYLETAVGSVLDQGDVDVDVIIIDDASDDHSADVAWSLADRDPRVRVIAHSTNVGHIATYNEGLGQAKGDYLVLLSADDALTGGSLARAVSLMQHHPGVGMVYGHSASFTEAVPDIDGTARSWTVWPGRSWLSSMCRRAKNPVYTPGVVMRREAWEEIGRYDARVPHAADMLLWYQTALRWEIGRVNNTAQALYRVHGSNMHLTQFAGMLRDLREQREVVRILFEEPLGGSPPPESLRVAGHRALSRRANRLAVAELREADDREAATAFRCFAAETTAAVPGSAPGVWASRVDRWLEGRHAAPVRKVERHVEWRLWRRYGT
jgi:hypothetical protein